MNDPLKGKGCIQYKSRILEIKDVLSIHMKLATLSLPIPCVYVNCTCVSVRLSALENSFFLFPNKYDVVL